MVVGNCKERTNSRCGGERHQIPDEEATWQEDKGYGYYDNEEGKYVERVC